MIHRIQEILKKNGTRIRIDGHEASHNRRRFVSDLLDLLHFPNPSIDSTRDILICLEQPLYKVIQALFQLAL